MKRSSHMLKDIIEKIGAGDLTTNGIFCAII